MKLLYVSCHSILEYDEVKLFAELGIDVFSHGTYKNPKQIDDPKRPTLDLPDHSDFCELIKNDDKMNIPQEIIDWADVILFNGRNDWVHGNWEHMRRKDVIFRSIGQATVTTENDLKPLVMQGLNIVRYSPRERTIPGYCGEDAMIRFYKDPEEWKDWNGHLQIVLNVTQDMIARDDHCNFQFFKDATDGFDRRLIGKGSEAAGAWGKGIITYEEMKLWMRSCRVYFYTGTYPAAYTLNFIEALMTGMPMIALGPLMGNSPYHHEQQTYEVPDFSNNGHDIMLVDDIKSAQACVRLLMESPILAAQISARSRKLAIDLFGKETIKKQWKKYFNV
jgi:glycosyltransferase involved in cell wall biosynthesis